MSMIQQHRILARPGLQKDFKDTYAKWETIYTQFVKVGTHDKPEISAATVAGPNRLIQTGRELEPVTYMEVVTGPKVMAVDKTYKGGYFLSKEAIDDDGYGKLNQGSKWLAEAAHYTLEYCNSAVMDDAFTGTNFKGMDNLPMYSTAHTLINSTATVANRPSTALSLSVASITALQDLGRKMKNESGDPMMVNYDTVMIGNDQGQINKLHQILDSTLEPFTANNQDNPIRKSFKPTKIIVNPYMTNTYHFHMISTQLNDLQLLFREKPTMADWYDTEVDASKIRARGRWIIWFRDWRAWAGTNPSA